MAVIVVSLRLHCKPTMNEKVDYDKELEVIRYLRSDVYKFDIYLLILIALGVLSQVLIPVIVPIFGSLAFFLFYKKLRAAAHYPCPKCMEPFGSKSWFVWGVGTSSCQNCGLCL